MQRSIKKLTPILYLLMLASCSLFTLKQKQSMPLLPPLQAVEAKVTKQKVTMSANAKSQTFIVISHTKQNYQALLLTPTGQTLLSMEYDGVTFKENNKMGIKLPAQEIMAIMQFASWPPNVIDTTYKQEEGWQLLIQPKLRRLSRNHKPILEVQYSRNGTIDVEHLQQHYHVHIQPLETPQP